jgi:hypothetical protein
MPARAVASVRAAQRRLARAHVAHQGSQDLGRSPGVDRRHPDPRAQLVAEHRADGVRVGRAAEEPKQRQVIHVAELGLAEPERLAEADREQAGVEPVAHGLAHTQVGRQGQRGDGLGEPQAFGHLHIVFHRRSKASGRDTRVIRRARCHRTRRDRAYRADRTRTAALPRHGTWVNHGVGTRRPIDRGRRGPHTSQLLGHRRKGRK